MREDDVVRESVVERVVRYGRFVLCVAMAALAVWRGSTFVDPAGAHSMMAPVMCAAFACAVLITGIALLVRDGETEAG